MKTLILINFAATLAMFGIIWLIQILHYPLFAQVGQPNWPAYGAAHINRITLIVLPLMFVEAITALVMLLNPVEGLPQWASLVGFVLVGVIWFMTVFVNAAQHQRLLLNFDLSLHAALVTSNWIRTIAWTLRAGLMFWLVSKLIIESS